MAVAVAPEANPVASASQPPPPPLPLARWSASGVLLVGEYAAASLAFDVQPLKAHATWIGWAGDAASILLVASTAVLVLARPPGSVALAEVRARVFPLPNVWV